MKNNFGQTQPFRLRVHLCVGTAVFFALPFYQSLKSKIMKRKNQALCVLAICGFFACNKSNTASQISLAPSTTTAKVGETVNIILTSTANVSRWTVTPSATATKTYGVTTSKINYFTFSQAGTYTVAVRARNVAYDSTLRQSLDSCWNYGGGSRGTCTPGIDTASIAITVTGK